MFLIFIYPFSLVIQSILLLGAILVGLGCLIVWYIGWAFLTVMVPFRYCTKPSRSSSPNKQTVEMIEKGLTKAKA